MGCCNSLSNYADSPPISPISPTTTSADNTPTTSKDVDDDNTPTIKADAETSIPTTEIKEIKITITKSLSSHRLSTWNMTAIEPHISRKHSSIKSRLDLTLDEDRLQFQIKMQIQETEEKFEREKIKQICDNIFDEQIKNQHNFCSLYQVFKQYATANWEKDRMDMVGLSKAMHAFGMVIDIDKDLQKLVWSTFDIDNNKEIDFADFSAAMSSIITSKDDDSLLLLFQIFDIDKDGYLRLYDIARVLLTQNHFAVVATGQDQQNLPKVIYTKKMCLKQSKKFIQIHDKDEDDKISFGEFKAMMMDKTEKDFMIINMEPPSSSFTLEAPRVSTI